MGHRLVFEPAAEDGYGKVPGGRALERVDAILDQLEDDPGNETVRRHRYLLNGLFGVDFTAGGEDWMLLWSMNRDRREQVVTIQYIGPVPRGRAL
jgi:hypothetical protein